LSYEIEVKIDVYIGTILDDFVSAIIELAKPSLHQEYDIIVR
jgi:uncharacterized NAD-dependent epimerase/dehydratase family protein